MNKFVIILLSFGLTTGTVKAQSIADTAGLQFLLQEFNKRNLSNVNSWEMYAYTNNEHIKKNKEYFRNNSLPDSLLINSKCLGDFNRDGIKDILINIAKLPEPTKKRDRVDFRSIVVFFNNLGVDTCIDLNPEFSHTITYSSSTKKRASDLIVIVEYSNRNDMAVFVKRSDTLQYYKNGFINHSSEKYHKTVKTVNYYATSPWYYNKMNEITILSEGVLFLNERHGLDSLFNYHYVINKKEAADFFGLLRKIDFENMNATYTIDGVFDASTAHLIIEFTDGSKKYIRDYDSYGNHSLRYVYSIIKKYIKYSNWHLIKMNLDRS
ncbi:MAG: hypothetical protein SFU21_08215 [Flavihumibacter sp.]|nr:hypothetical protein [Flavihumibacter sp.]